MPLPGTLSSCTIADLFVTSSISVLIMIEVFLPFASRLASNFSKMKVHWLQLSSSPYVFTILPVFLYCNLTGTTHILMTFVTVFTNAHLTPPSISSSLFWFFQDDHQGLHSFYYDHAGLLDVSRCTLYRLFSNRSLCNPFPCDVFQTSIVMLLLEDKFVSFFQNLLEIILAILNAMPFIPHQRSCFSVHCIARSPFLWF